MLTVGSIFPTSSEASRLTSVGVFLHTILAASQSNTVARSPSQGSSLPLPLPLPLPLSPSEDEGGARALAATV